MSFKFEMLKEQSSIIKVIGVGGGGGNAVNHMYRQGISGVDFIICNTDAQALETSPIPNKVQLGASLTEGMGAGADPSVGENSAIESIEDIKRMLGTNTKMLFITAGMGGGTGTGASPVLAKAARELGILTVAIITTPFAFEGKRRKMQAEEGLNELKKYVDSYLIISNDRLREIFGNLTMTAAFAKADDILTTAAKGIAEIITIPGYVNVDFKDVNTVMSSSGVCIMGNSIASGENRAFEAVEGALASPLLKDSEIEGARFILLNITSGNQEVTMDEVSIITDYIQDKSGMTADLIWGNCIDPNMGDELSVTIIATGFQTSDERVKEQETRKVEIPLLDVKRETPVVRPVNQFIKAEETPGTIESDYVSPDPQQSSASAVFLLEEEQDAAADTQKQVDLFSWGGTSEPVNDQLSDPRGTQDATPGMRDETPKSDGIIRYALQEEEHHVEESPETKEEEYQLKTSASIFHFEKPGQMSSFGHHPAQQNPSHQNPVQVNPTHRDPAPQSLVTHNSPVPHHPAHHNSEFRTPAHNQIPVEKQEQHEQQGYRPQYDFNDQPQRIMPTEPAFEFELPSNEPVVEEEAYKTDEFIESQLSKTKDRIMRLKELSMKLRTSNGLQEIETEPAYKRKKMNLDQVPHSSESQVSRFTLSVDGGVTEIKPNNSFLHDNVD